MQLKLFSFQEYEYSSLEGDIRKIAASPRTKNIKFNSVIKFTTRKNLRCDICLIETKSDLDLSSRRGLHELNIFLRCGSQQIRNQEKKIHSSCRIHSHKLWPHLQQHQPSEYRYISERICRGEGRKDSGFLCFGWNHHSKLTYKMIKKITYENVPSNVSNCQSSDHLLAPNSLMVWTLTRYRESASSP